jgi:hypothetical protein
MFFCRTPTQKLFAQKKGLGGDFFVGEFAVLRRHFFVGDGLARPVTINKSRIVWRCAFIADAQCTPNKMGAPFFHKTNNGDFSGSRWPA